MRQFYDIFAKLRQFCGNFCLYLWHFSVTCRMLFKECLFT
uniref:Uncharacterized protein n=1 Tax=Siphoviridae sp. ctmHK36 TaxID=2827931 RepID=A0A8S5TCG8_9CAUD|nr:MAG TPA: hypothetical protein [Siphoviridae sp. ctmHK36]